MLEAKNLGSTISARCPKCGELCRWDVYRGQTDLGFPAATFEFWCEGDQCNWNPRRRISITSLVGHFTTNIARFNEDGVLDM